MIDLCIWPFASHVKPREAVRGVLSAVKSNPHVTVTIAPPDSAAHN
jgi:hypothetical protein